MFHEWHPTVVHDLHEGSPFLMTWNGTGPYNPNIDPITYTEFLEMSFHEVQTMTAMGMPGVSTWNFGEAFAHLYLDSVAMNHNSIGRGYETWGNGTAETLRRTFRRPSSTMEWYRPLPPPAGEVTWSARDNLNYQETGSAGRARLRARATPRRCCAIFTKRAGTPGRKGLNEPPYAFLIPEGQGDPTRVAQMVGRLIGQHIEVGRAQKRLQAERWRLSRRHLRRAPRSALSQLRRRFAHAAALSQGWQRALRRRLLGIARALSSERDSTADAAIRTAALTPLNEATASGRRSGRRGPSLFVERHRPGRTARGALPPGQFQIEIAEHEFQRRRKQFPCRIVDSARARWTCRCGSQSTATELGLDFASVAAAPDVPRHAAKAPRIGVWVPWADTDSIGWIRYSLDQRKVPYTYLRDEDIRAGDLRDQDGRPALRPRRPRTRRTDSRFAKAWGPMPFKKTPQTPSFGTPAESDDITGGIGWDGLAQIQLRRGRRPARDPGQRLACLRSKAASCAACDASSGGVPRSAAGRRSRSAAAAQQAATRTPGAHVRVTFDQPRTSPGLRISGAHLRLPPEFSALRCAAPLAAHGLLHHLSRRPKIAATSSWNGATRGGDRSRAVVVSGQAWGGAEPDRPSGDSRSCPRAAATWSSFNFNPIHRDMNRGDQRLLWNAITQLAKNPRSAAIGIDDPQKTPNQPLAEPKIS